MKAKPKMNKSGFQVWLEALKEDIILSIYHRSPYYIYAFYPVMPVVTAIDNTVLCGRSFYMLPSD